MGTPVLLTGCSGGGKSTLLAEMARRGWSVRAEPGRRVVEDEMTSGGTATPWTDIAAFEDRCIALALADHLSALQNPGPVLCDRGLVDALCNRARRQPLTAAEHALLHRVRYAETVIFAPPWPALFQPDEARRHGLAEAVAEAEALQAFLPEIGYRVATLPRAPVGDRAAWLEARLAAL